MEGSTGDKSTPKGGQLPSASRKNNKSITPFQKSSTPSSTTGRTLTLKLSKSNKSARAYKQTYSTGPPLVPNYIFTRLVEYLGKIKLARKPAFVGLVCKYWSLKRESRRGAPLLKRLHLEVGHSLFCFCDFTREGVLIIDLFEYSLGLHLLLQDIKLM